MRRGSTYRTCFRGTGDLCVEGPETETSVLPRVRWFVGVGIIARRACTQPASAPPPIADLGADASASCWVTRGASGCALRPCPRADPTTLDEPLRPRGPLAARRTVGKGERQLQLPTPSGGRIVINACGVGTVARSCEGQRHKPRHRQAPRTPGGALSLRGDTRASGRRAPDPAFSRWRIESQG